MSSERVNSFLEEIKKEHGSLPSDLHITRKACALVAISQGKVIKIEKPKIEYCPLFKVLFSSDSIDRKSIKNKFARQINEWGMFTCNRKICNEKIIVPFGASEMMMYALKRKNIDVAVTVCEGAGTVITSNPGVVQGIGAYMNGLFYTTPILKVISDLESKNSLVLSPIDAKIEQSEGVRKAINLGYKNIVVTVRGDEDNVIPKIRNLEKENNISITILVVCNSGVDRKQALTIRDHADMVWACASKYIREVVGPVSILQIGMRIPVFVLTEKGIDFVTNYSSDNKLKDRLKGLKYKHYITSSRYEEGGIKMNMGKFSVYLYEAEKLPVNTFDEPRPLM